MALERAFDEGRFAAEVGEALEKSNKQGKTSLKRLPQAQNFVSSFFARTAPGDVRLHDADVWATVLTDLFEFVHQRDAGNSKVRVFNPEAEQNGWQSRSTVVQVVTDDSPFLVDSVSMAVTAQHLDSHAVIHPVMTLQRDDHGEVVDMGGNNGHAESLMHFEIDRITDADERQALQERIVHILDDVQAAVR